MDLLLARLCSDFIRIEFWRYFLKFLRFGSSQNSNYCVTVFHTRIRRHPGLSNQIRARFSWGWTYCLRVYTPISLESNFGPCFRWNSACQLGTLSEWFGLSDTHSDRFKDLSSILRSEYFPKRHNNSVDKRSLQWILSKPKCWTESMTLSLGFLVHFAFQSDSDVSVHIIRYQTVVWVS